MITEDYVSFEVAKLLKEKGFDGWCFGYYKPNNEFGTYVMPRTYSGVEGNYILAPTHQIALKWLREVFKIYIRIIEDVFGKTFEWQVYENGRCRKMHFLEDTYEDAVEAAIKYCLTDII